MKVYNKSEVISSNNLDLDDQTVGSIPAPHCISKQTLMTVAFQRLLNLCPACLFVFFFFCFAAGHNCFAQMMIQMTCHALLCAAQISTTFLSLAI